MDVSCECCVLSDTGLCVGLITRREESYRVWCVCDRETQIMRRPWPTRGCHTKEKKSGILSYWDLKSYLVLSLYCNPECLNLYGIWGFSQHRWEFNVLDCNAMSFTESCRRFGIQLFLSRRWQQQVPPPILTLFIKICLPNQSLQQKETFTNPLRPKTYFRIRVLKPI
jgi:hypothetical protein